MRESTCQTGTAVVGCELKAAHLERTQLRAVPPRAERERERGEEPEGGGKSGILHHAPVLRSGLERRRRRRKRTLRWTFALPARTRGRGGMEANGGTHGELDGAWIYNPVALGVHPRTTPPHSRLADWRLLGYQRSWDGILGWVGVVMVILVNLSAGEGLKRLSTSPPWLSFEGVDKIFDGRERIPRFCFQIHRTSCRAQLWKYIQTVFPGFSFLDLGGGAKTGPGDTL